MNFIKKLKIAAGLQSEKTENDIDQNNFDIQPNDTIEEIFAKTLLRNNGKFFYCAKKDDLIKTIKALVKKINIDSLYCIEKILQDLLNNAGINQNKVDYTKCDAIISSCEYLIAHHGKIMLSSKQLGPNTIKNLPDQHIVIAYTSQIVKNLNEAMAGINTRYIHEGLPSTITTIKSIHNNEQYNIEGNTKNLSVILIEDFRR
tara:strand:+ start:84 stop:689 length:606 start_codon:yes stop_codon:yes gene_type:complete